MKTCDTCGGTLVFIGGDLAKCEYCGRYFSMGNNTQLACNIDGVYIQACRMLASQDQNERNEGIRILKAIDGYKDSGTIVSQYYSSIKLEQDRALEARRQAELAEIERKKQAEKSRLVRTVLIVFGSIATIALIGFYFVYLLPRQSLIDNSSSSNNRSNIERIANNSDRTADNTYDYSTTTSENYTSYVPKSISLLSLEPYTSMPFQEADYSIEDLYGTKYNCAIYTWEEKENGPTYCTYRLNSAYSELRFVSGVVSWGRGVQGTASILIVGDGKELYSRELTCESDSLDVKLDVSGIKDLTIELYGVEEYFDTLPPALFDPTLISAN